MNLLVKRVITSRRVPLRTRHYACTTDSTPVDIPVSVSAQTQAQSRLRKPSKQIFSVTPTAKKQLQYLLQKSDPPAKVIRVGTKAGGCSGWIYTMDLLNTPPPGDEIVKDEGVTISVDPKALIAIVGTEMDFVSNKIKQEFVFSNPNATSECGCGESFSIS